MGDPTTTTWGGYDEATPAALDAALAPMRTQRQRLWEAVNPDPYGTHAERWDAIARAAHASTQAEVRFSAQMFLTGNAYWRLDPDNPDPYGIRCTWVGRLLLEPT